MSGIISRLFNSIALGVKKEDWAGVMAFGVGTSLSPHPKTKSAFAISQRRFGFRTGTSRFRVSALKFRSSRFAVLTFALGFEKSSKETLEKVDVSI